MSFWVPSKHLKIYLVHERLSRLLIILFLFPPSLKVIVHRFNCSQAQALETVLDFSVSGLQQMLFSEVGIIYCSLAWILKWFRNKSLREDLSEQSANIHDGYLTSLSWKRDLFELEPQLPSNVLPLLNCTFLTKQTMAFYTNKSAPGFLFPWTLHFFSWMEQRNPEE